MEVAIHLEFVLLKQLAGTAQRDFRDLGGIVRRPFVDMKKPETERANPMADMGAAIAVLSVLSATILIALAFGNRRSTGLSAGFLLLGCYLSCYRFMYYDAMLASVGFAALFANVSWMKRGRVNSHWRWVQPFQTVAFAVLLTLLVVENIVTTWGLKGRISADIFGGEKNPRGLEWEIGFRYAWDTLLILGLWAWLGFRLFGQIFGELPDR